MKLSYGAAGIFAISLFVSCSGAVKQTTPVSSAETNQTVNDQAVTNGDFDKALAEFKTVELDIPFASKSAELKIDDQAYYMKNQSIEDYVKKNIIPARSRVIKLMPAGKMVIINGYARKTGTEEASQDFIGNIALSKNRAETVLDYIIKNSDIDRSKFNIQANGSSNTLPGLDPADIKNCRVSIDIE